MNKRLGFVSLFAVTALLLVIVGAVTALAAPSGAVGTVDFNRDWTNLGNTLTVSVTDADENTPVFQTLETAGKAGTSAYSVGTGASPVTIFPTKSPIADWVAFTEDTAWGDGDGTLEDDEQFITKAAFLAACGIATTGTDAGDLELCNEPGGTARDNAILGVDDVVVIDVSTNLKSTTASVVDIGANTVTIARDATAAAFKLSYFGSEANTVTVTVKSTSDQTGLDLTATETALNSGLFKASFTLGSATLTATSVLQAADGNVITGSYKDASEGGEAQVSTVNVELADPESTNLTPADAVFTNQATVVLSGDVTDAQAGVKKTSIKFYLSNNGTSFEEVTNSSAGSGTFFTNGAYSVTTITGGNRATVQVTLTTDGAYSWYLQSDDNAGNTGASQGDPDETTDFGADNAHGFTLDRVSLKLTASDPKAILGQWWDSTKTGSARLITDATKGKNTSVRLIFDTSIDGTSVEDSDFRVDGDAPAKAEWFSGLKDSVFLTVAAKGASATPKVEVVGSVRDAAGNANIDTLKVTSAKDGLAPKFTVNVTGTDATVPLSKDEIVIKVTANETLLTNPSIEAASVVENSAGDLIACTVGACRLTDVGGLTFLGTDQWQRKLDVDSFLSARTAGATAAFVVKVTGSDTAGNTGTAGGTDPESSSAILFEMDDSLPSPTLDPADDANVYRTDPFVTITWTGEGTEYDGDTNKAVTLTVLTLDDVDVLASSASTDNRTFILSTSGLALGDHDLEINGTDAAGNKLSSNASITFTVKEVAKVSVPLKPGMNLVSLPGEAADSAINSVISISQVSSVVTYDPINPDPDTGSPWLSATRDASGVLGGSLATIDAQHGYWVKTTSFDPIKVAIPEQGFASLPPSISVVAGWNLVPVVTVSDADPGDTINADTYFGSTKWITAYTFDPQANAWTKVLPSTFSNVTVGKGYWLYTSAAGILVP